VTRAAGIERISVPLDPGPVAEVLALLRVAGDADGAYPLSEHAVLHLRHGADGTAVHLFARTGDGRLVGYAIVDPSDPVEGAAAELVVHPLHRHQGLGRALAEAAIAVADERAGGRLQVWAHGDHPSASALAISLGFRRARGLLQLRRSLRSELPEPVLPPGVHLRAFRPGDDDPRWLAVNAAAFTRYPDQGGWTEADLRARIAEPWFDPAGFFLAEDAAGALLGFHWTKVHGPIGEVYVIAVSPTAGRPGLGTALMLAGLRYLRGRGLAEVMLYVDESNERAVALYDRLGFVRWSTDVSFRRSG
jgi:mycothiol synthase